LIRSKNDYKNYTYYRNFGFRYLENAKTLINFKENYLVFNLAETPSQYTHQLMDFKFKKRKIILKGMLKGKEKTISVRFWNKRL
jgi:hypothetical protein